MNSATDAYRVLAEAFLRGLAAGCPDWANTVQTRALSLPIDSEKGLSGDCDPMEMLGLVAAGSFDARTLAWVQRGMAAYMRAGGEVQFERCFHLPNTFARRRLMQRNVWLAEAAKHVSCTSSWLGAVALVDELNTFLSRGLWNAWRDLPQPPEGASELRTALYHVAKANDGKSLSVKQVHRIAGHVFP